MRRLLLNVLWAAFVTASTTSAQPLGAPDRGAPGDVMIQNYLRHETVVIHDRFAADIQSSEHWQTQRERYHRQYLHMLGLWPLPERSPLNATVTGTLDGEGFVVEKLHYQSRPGLYVTGNLYRPADSKPGQRFPAIFYVCGHAGRGREGNKTAYQSHGIWFARHGYVCLIVDTLQLGEIAATHHGTYNENRWWWHSRGYTSAGVECWNGVRGIDYLISRDDVDPDRIGVTGISGGGAATFWVAAADERVSVAVPVSGMADLPAYVPNRVINGHCDCMFLYNTFQWPWVRIAALVAPRPLLFVNSDQDSIFPMDVNDRVITRLERLYSLYGAGDRVDSMVSIGGHAYREDIRNAVYRFLNVHLKNDAREVTDSEVDLVTGTGNSRVYPIEPERLRVFSQDSDIPGDERNTTIDQHFVPMAKVDPPQAGDFERWKNELVAKLRDVTFRSFPDRVPPAKRIPERSIGGTMALQTEPGIEISIRRCGTFKPVANPRRVLLVVTDPDSAVDVPEWVHAAYHSTDEVWFCDVRGVGATRWTIKNPPNYVERSHALLGRTVDTGRVRDIIAVARWMHEQFEGKVSIAVAGHGRTAVLAAYAALLEPEIAEVSVDRIPASHMDGDAPQFLNALRVCDIPDVLGMLAPRPLTIRRAPAAVTTKVKAVYSAAEAETKVTTE